MSQSKKIAENRFKNDDALELDILTISSKKDEEQNRKLELETLLQKQLNVLYYSTGIENFNQIKTDFNFSAGSNLATKEEIIKEALETNLDFKLTKQKSQLA